MAKSGSKSKVRTKKREKKIVAKGQAHIQATFNNVIVTITDLNGNVLCWSSSGSNSFRGSRKSTPYAAQISAEVSAKRALEFGMKEIEVFVAGPGMCRESAIRALQNNGLQVVSIKDVSGIPHNGCRPPKRRRV
ncbi:MAG: 30S ribosomal protein S11 [Candidatus Rifleibacteriota bacterium]